MENEIEVYTKSELKNCYFGILPVEGHLKGTVSQIFNSALVFILENSRTLSKKTWL